MRSISTVILGFFLITTLIECQFSTTKKIVSEEMSTYVTNSRKMAVGFLFKIWDN